MIRRVEQKGIRLHTIISLLSLATLFLGGAHLARAQSAKRPTIELSVFSGGSATRASDLYIRQDAVGTNAVFENVDWRGRPFFGSLYYGYRIDTFLPKQPRLGFEIDFLHYKAYAKVEESRHVVGTWQGAPVDTDALMSDRVQEFRITNGVNTITFGMLYRLTLDRSPSYPDGRLQPYIGGGPAYNLLFPINIVAHEPNFNHRYQWSGWGYTAQAGVRYSITSHIRLFAEARYTRCDARVGVAEEGQADTDLSTWHSIGGLTYAF